MSIKCFTAVLNHCTDWHLQINQQKTNQQQWRKGGNHVLVSWESLYWVRNWSSRFSDVASISLSLPLLTTENALEIADQQWWILFPLECRRNMDIWHAHKSGPTDLCADLQICLRENECFWWNSLTSPLNLSELLHRFSCRFQIYKSTNWLLHRFSCRFQIYKTTIWLLHIFSRFADLQSWKRIHSLYGGRGGQKSTNKSL